MKTQGDVSFIDVLRARLEAKAQDARTQARDDRAFEPEPDMPAVSDVLPLDLERILTAAGETAYRWHVASDHMVWAANAASVFRMPETGPIGTGSAYGMHIDSENASLRYDTIMACSKEGAAAPYRVQYRLMPEGRRGETALWVEDEGRCRIDADGRPELAEGIVRVINDRREHEQRLLFLSGHDELTGQMNRTKLTDAIYATLQELGTSARSGALLLAAVNDLTIINESYGFEAGDEVISVVGRRLRQSLRGRDCIGRYSSNKFGILLPDSGLDTLRAVGERMHACVRNDPVLTRGGSVAATIAVGGVLIPEQAETVDQALGHALCALDRSRASRGGGLVLYEPSQRRESRRRRNVAIADEIIRALNDNRMVLALQPIVSAGGREPALHECLLRMRRPDGTIFGAIDFIPVAEQFGLCRLVDRRTLELAIDLMRSQPELKLSLNVSGMTATDPDWLKALEALVCGDRSLTERLTVEITETAAILDLEASVSFVRALQTMGCKVAIDDFGAGYTSFRSLKMLGVDMLKIDGTFVKNLGHCAEDQVFIRTLIELAQNIGIETVGEWVGDAATADMLESAGITYMQGFHFGAPKLAGSEQATAVA